MAGLKAALAAAVNRVARPFGVAVVPAWQWSELTTGGVQTFRLGGLELPYFHHHYNCGPYAATASERTVELAIADHWLGRAPADKLIEVGAVTPYYWPGRVTRVADPADTHSRVTDRAGIEALDLTGAAVLSLSTFEHIGSGEYGLPPDPAALRGAVDKLTREAAAFLLTVPAGYTPHADAAFFADPPAGVNAYYLVRHPVPPYWREVKTPAEARRAYGPAASPIPGGWGAHGLAVWERGGFLAGPGGGS
ncbi:MAG TPA: hypothetical protein VH092_24140 [Urbifossiella sp.]|nr:hypothetical protein [Urbifossiella sp.]